MKVTVINPKSKYQPGEVWERCSDGFAWYPGIVLLLQFTARADFDSTEWGWEVLTDSGEFQFIWEQTLDELYVRFVL